MTPAPIVYINSWPGVGKHTIAKALKGLLGDDARIVHNHQHIDLADTILPRSSPDYHILRRSIRAALFKTLKSSTDTHSKIYIFTDSQLSNPQGRSNAAQEYANAAKARGCAFIPIILDCSEVENVKRLRSEARIELVEKRGKGMLIDNEVLAEMREKNVVFRFRCAEEMVLDISGMGPESAAEMIRRHVDDVVGRADTAEVE